MTPPTGSTTSSKKYTRHLWQGHKHFSGFEEVVLRNITACKEISAKIKRSFGPNGTSRLTSALKKMVVNHIDKTFVTSDAATILKEMEIAHPAAKMLQLACKMQEEECGDATNFVVTFAGELLNHAENLIRMGLHPSQIVMGYEEASKKALEFLNEIESYKVEDLRNVSQVATALKATVGSKVPNYCDFFSDLVARACINSLPEVAGRFDIDNVRVIQILGSSINDSTFMSGMVVKRAAEGSIDRMAKPKIACYSCPLDTQYAETKGTVLISNASELLNYSKGEEDLAEKFVQKLVNANINVVVVGATIADIVLHFLDKYKIMAVRIMSKFELRRIARAIRATILSKLEAPTPDEVGESDDVCVDEIASEKLVVFKRNTEDCKLSTIILRGSTKNVLEDVERAIDDGVNVFRSIVREREFCPGAGSTEIVLLSINIAPVQQTGSRSQETHRPRPILLQQIRQGLRSIPQDPLRKRRPQRQRVRA